MINKDHSNYKPFEMPEKVVHLSVGSNRLARRHRYSSGRGKQFHLRGKEQVYALALHKGLVKNHE